MTGYALYGTEVEPQGRSGRVREISPHGIRFPDRPPRSESYWLSYPDHTLSEDMCSNVRFICISSRIFPNPEYKDAVPDRFAVSDHDILLWRSHHYTCTYCKESVLSLLLKMKDEGALFLENQATRQERILGLWRYNFVLVGCVGVLTEHVKRGVHKYRATWCRSPRWLISLKVVPNIWGSPVRILFLAPFLAAEISTCPRFLEKLWAPCLLKMALNLSIRM